MPIYGIRLRLHSASQLHIHASLHIFYSIFDISFIKAIQPQNIDEIMEQEDNVPSVDDDGNSGEEEDSEDGEEDNSEDDNGEDSEDGDGVSGHVFSDVGAEFRADIRNALGDLAAVDSDQVYSTVIWI